MMADAKIASLIFSLFAGSMVIVLRMRSSNRPTNLMKIVMPPIGMATGFMMFTVPDTRIPWFWALVAFLIGSVFFAYPLIRTTKLEIRDGTVYMTRSKAFIFIIVGMLALRVALHDWVEQYITVVQSAGVFFTLAFGMILFWRIAMLRAYLKLKAGPAAVDPV